MANTKNFIAKNGVSTGDGYAMPDVRPSLLLDFANSKTLDPRITFTRGSTATYWDGHTTTKAEENLAKYSQDYSQSDWSKFNLTVTDDAATAPDGSTTAASLITNTANNNHYIAYNYGDLANVQVTQSWYAKANGYNHCFIGHGIGTTEGAWFNLSTGATGTIGGTISSSSITSVGNSWYRCSITYTVSQTVRYAIIAPTNADGTVSFTGDGTSGIYAWGAQVEQRSSATAYTATTSSSIVKYQPTLQTAASGEARFDHDPVTGESKGLLIEESRSNSHFSNTFEFDYNGGGASRVYDQGIAPDGTHTAAQMIESTTTGPHVYDAYTLFPSTGTGTASMFVKGVGHVKGVYLNYYDAFGGQTIQGTTFKLIGEGTASDANGTIKYVGNGWYRISRTWTAIANNGSVLRLGLVSGTTEGSFGTGSYTGDGWSGVLIWGTQQEAGAFPTSYIPNTVGGSTVTRSVDSALMIGSNFTDWFSNEESTVFVDFERRNANQSGTYPMIAALSDGTTDNVLSMYLNNGETFFYETRAFNSTNAILSTTVTTQGSAYKAAGVLKTNDMAASFNGATVTTDTDALNPPNINRLDLGSRVSLLPYTGTIKKFAYYPQRLSNATLQAMTEE